MQKIMKWKSYFIGLIVLCSIIFCGNKAFVWAEESLPGAGYVTAEGTSGIFANFEHGDSINGGFSSGYATGSYDIRDNVYTEGLTSSFTNVSGPTDPGEFWSAFSVDSNATAVAGSDYNVSVTGGGEQATFRAETNEFVNGFADGVSAGNMTGLAYSGESSSNPSLFGGGSGVGWTSIVRPDENTIIGETYGEVQGVNPGTLNIYGGGGASTYKTISEGDNIVSGGSLADFNFDTTGVDGIDGLFGNAKSETMGVLDVHAGGVYGQSVSSSSSRIGNPSP